MPEVAVITDTSCLIALSNIDSLDLLKSLYSAIIITPEIEEEFGYKLPEWIIVQSVRNKKYQFILENTLDKGESSAIALALELGDVLLILDDLKGRKEALKLGFRITGTLGVLFKAKQLGLIDSMKLYIGKLKAIGFRIAEDIEFDLLKRSNEKL